MGLYWAELGLVVVRWKDKSGALESTKCCAPTGCVSLYELTATAAMALSVNLRYVVRRATTAIWSSCN